MKPQPKPEINKKSKMKLNDTPFGIGDIIFRKLWKARQRNELDGNVK